MDRFQCAERIRGGALKILARSYQAAERRNRRRRQGLAEEEGRGRLGLSALAEGIWRGPRHPPRGGGLGTGRRGLPQAAGARAGRGGGGGGGGGGPARPRGPKPPPSTN